MINAQNPSIARMWIENTNEKTRFILVGGVGAFIAWVTYSLIYHALTIESKALVAWIIGYIIAVAQQHTLHRRYTFFSRNQDYFPELIRAYGAYSIGLIISTLTHGHLTLNLSVYHQLSWLISTGISVIANFIMLKLFVFEK